MSECGFNRLSELNNKRAGEQYPEIGAWSPMQWGCAMAGEAGELCNVVKKLERGRDEDLDEVEQLIRQIGEEAADIIIYLDLLLKGVNLHVARNIGEHKVLDLRGCVRDKFNKTSEKIGSGVFW